jgi:hypothetical protein
MVWVTYDLQLWIYKANILSKSLKKMAWAIKGLPVFSIEELRNVGE